MGKDHCLHGAHTWVPSACPTLVWISDWALLGTGLISTRTFPPSNNVPFPSLSRSFPAHALSLYTVPGHWTWNFYLLIIFIYLIIILQGKYDLFPSCRGSWAIVRLCDLAKATQLAMEMLDLENRSSHLRSDSLVKSSPGYSCWVQSGRRREQPSSPRWILGLKEDWPQLTVINSRRGQRAFFSQYPCL